MLLGAPKTVSSPGWTSPGASASPHEANALPLPIAVASAELPQVCWRLSWTGEPKTGSSSLDVIQQVLSRGRNHLPYSAGSASIHTAQDTVVPHCCQAHCWLMPSSPAPTADLPHSRSSPPVLLPRGQDFAFFLMEFREVAVGCPSRPSRSLWTQPCPWACWLHPHHGVSWKTSSSFSR